MADIFRFQPSDLGNPTTQGGDIANSFFNTFLGVRQSARADQSMANESKRLDMAQQQFDQQTEDRAYDNAVMRPLRENEAKLRIGAQGLAMAQESQKIQLNAMEIGSKLVQKDRLKTILSDMTLQGGAGGGVGKVTSYGYQSDTTPDDASLGRGKYSSPTGAWSNKLNSESLAISPDVERDFKKMGIREGDKVKLKLADGSEVVRQWDDRTMQDKEATEKFGKPLTGRFDFYTPEGPDKRDGQAVVGFERFGAPLSPERVQSATGAPVYADAAASTDPISVINSTFSPRQTQFLSHYDELQVIARGQDKEDSMQAQIMLKQFEANPEFQQTLGQRDLMLGAARNQAAITSSILSARQDQLADFQRAYPQYTLNAQTNGQVVPINGITNQPLSPQEQVSFGNAWAKHSSSFRPQIGNTLGDTLAGKYASHVATYEAGKDLVGTDEETVKLKRAAAGAKAAMNALESLDPTLSAMRRQKDALAASEAARIAAEKGTATGGASAAPAPQAPTESMTVEELRAQKKQQDTTNLRMAKMQDVTATVNTFAAKLAKTEGIPVSAINIANEILKGGDSLKQLPPGARFDVMPSGPRSLAGVGKMTSEEFYAQQLKIPVSELREWAKATVAQRAPAAPAGGGLTPEQKAFMDRLLKEG